MKKIKALIVVGTRPEAIKLYSLIKEMRGDERFQPVVCSTGQHEDMLKQMFSDLYITPDIELHVMKKGQDLSALGAKLLVALQEVIAAEKPDVVIVQGDTSSALFGAVAAFYNKIPVAHIEAGLRSFNKAEPFPEEFHRQAISLATNWHFAPTTASKENLLRENIPEEQIHVVGNTVVDALLDIAKSPAHSNSSSGTIPQGRPFILVTMHRRENWGQPIKDICSALNVISERHPDINLVLPLHINPTVRATIKDNLVNRANVIFTEPLSYTEMVRTIHDCLLVLSDSGGIQEEAPVLGKRVVVLRDTTERPEPVDAGINILAGSNPQKIVAATEEILKKLPASPVKCFTGFGLGNSAQQILDILSQDHSERNNG